MKFKSTIITFDIIIIIIFFCVVAYPSYNVNTSDIVTIDDSVEPQDEIDNPFYVDDGNKIDKKEEENKVSLLVNVKNNVADLSKWVWPTDKPYVITSYYSYRWGTFHDAIDIYSYSGFGSNVYAANNGTVVEVVGGCIPGYTSCNGGKGNYIVINHNNSNYYTIYMHLNTMLVGPNVDVSAGDVIATIGNTGNVSPVPSNYNPYGGTHLHFGTFIGNPIYGGRSFNPLSLY